MIFLLVFYRGIYVIAYLHWVKEPCCNFKNMRSHQLIIMNDKDL